MYKRFYSTEDDKIVTLEHLKKIFDDWYRDEYEPNEFPLFVRHCMTDQNGTLIPIDDRYPDDTLYRDIKTGRIYDRKAMLDAMFWYGYSSPTDDEIFEHFNLIGN